MVWKIGPAWVAQQAKNVAASTMNGVERSAAPTAIGDWPVALDGSISPRGVRRTKRAAGIRSTHTTRPMVSCALRQSVFCSSHAANGETVIGATPIPAETRDTARLRRFGSHALTAVIIGTMKLPAERPTTTPYASRNC